MIVQLRSVPGTNAALGWAGTHTLVVDRPEGRAGGQGLGFNGGQLLALSIGGCFCNDLHYAAHDLGIRLRYIEVDVELTLEGSPLLATKAHLFVTVKADDPAADLDNLVSRADEISTVSNSLRRGISVETSIGR
ncbi:MAG TPA: OsmC family protein [Erythrobacter sp.]|nr:OsmC family protein [Erythrobacter sp.]